MPATIFTIAQVAITRFLLCWLLISAISTASAQQTCETTNDALQAMPEAIVTFLLADGQIKEFNVRLADNQFTRAAGFQRVCASTIAEQPILFVFQNEIFARFHMRNVVAPIDIAFIDVSGKIDSIKAMQPYVLGSKVKPTYRSEDLVIAALETYPGFYRKYSIDSSTKLSWRMSEP